MSTNSILISFITVCKCDLIPLPKNETLAKVLTLNTML